MKDQRRRARGGVEARHRTEAQMGVDGFDYHSRTDTCVTSLIWPTKSHQLHVSLRGKLCNYSALNRRQRARPPAEPTGEL